MQLIWSWLRARRPRGSGGFVTTGVAVALLLSTLAVGLGHGATSALLRLGAGSAWLSNSGSGSVSLVNGSSGHVAGVTVLRDARGHILRIVQDGESVLIFDETTGEVSRLDAAQLKIDKTTQLGSGGQVVSGRGRTYFIDPGGGVRRVDPATLQNVGEPVQLPPPVGTATIADDNRLWAPVIGSGSVVPVDDRGAGPPVAVGHNGDDVAMVLAGGRPVAVDATQGQFVTVSARGAELTVHLPPDVAGKALKTSPSSSTPLVASVVPDKGLLELVDMQSGAERSIPLGPDVTSHQWGVPQANDGKVYLPDETEGSLVVFDVQQDRFDRQIPVGGPNQPIEVVVKDGLLYANAPNSAAAVVVGADGRVNSVDKYTADVAGALGMTLKALPKPAPLVVPPAPARQPNATSPQLQAGTQPSTVVPRAVPVAPGGGQFAPTGGGSGGGVPVRVPGGVGGGPSQIPGLASPGNGGGTGPVTPSPSVQGNPPPIVVTPSSAPATALPTTPPPTTPPPTTPPPTSPPPPTAPPQPAPAPQPQPAPPVLSLSRGPAAPYGYRYALTLSNFAPNSRISMQCYDSVSPGGFYPFTLTTNGAGGASTASYCYSGDGPDHWATANGVMSNHVTW